MLQGFPSLMAAKSVPVAVTIANNVVLVSGQSGGAIGTGVSTVSFAMPANVTNGNIVLVGINMEQTGSSDTMAITELTKSAGTATIGTIVMDANSNPTAAPTVGVAIFRVPITGTGSLTLLYTPSTAGLWNLQIGCAEFSGLNATPLDAGGTNSGTGTNHTTGSLTTSVPGLIYYTATEIASGNFTRTISDTTVRNDQSGVSAYTGLIQFKLISTSPNTLTDTTGADSSAWKVAYAKYKTS